MGCSCRKGRSRTSSSTPQVTSAPSASRTYELTTPSGEVFTYTDRVQARANQIVKGGTLKTK